MQCARLSLNENSIILVIFCLKKNANYDKKKKFLNKFKNKKIKSSNLMWIISFDKSAIAI